MRAHLTPDQSADRLASRQHGVLTLDQALGYGLTPGQIKRRVATGRWIRLARCVYAVASSPPTWRRAAVAACFAGPPGTATSHLTAAALHGFRRPPSRPHITVPRATSGRPGIARVHWSRLEPADRTRVDGIPCTSPARMLVECAGLLPIRPLADLLDQALCQGSTSVEHIQAAIDRASRRPGRKGVARLREVLGIWTDGIEPGSPAEVRLLRRIVEWGFERPAPQVVVCDGEGRFVARLDLAWPDRKVGLEYDSRRHHGLRQIAHHEQRYLTLDALGWNVRGVEKGELLPGEVGMRTWLHARLPR